MINVISGYCAINTSPHWKRPIWVGVIEGNMYCKKRRYNVDIALEDAKKKLNQLKDK